MDKFLGWLERNQRLVLFGGVVLIGLGVVLLFAPVYNRLGISCGSAAAPDDHRACLDAIAVRRWIAIVPLAMGAVVAAAVKILVSKGD